MKIDGSGIYPHIVEMLRVHFLRVLFPPAVTWALLLFFVEETGLLQGLNPLPENDAWHGVFELMAYWFPALLVFTALIWLLRRYPRFLRLPSSLHVIGIAARIVVHGAVLFVYITLVTVLVSYLFHEPQSDPHGQFHIWVWGGGLLYAAALAPPAVIAVVWPGVRGDRDDG